MRPQYAKSNGVASGQNIKPSVILMENSSPSYKPSTGLISYIPPSCVPYGELMRVDRPIAFFYLYFPCLFGTLMAASISNPIVPPRHLLAVNLTFILGSFLVRCTGCTWNDIVDQDIDRKVSRTRNRPLARRALSTYAALIFTAVQVAIGLCLVYVLLPLPCLLYSVPSIFLTGLYPFAKRFTYYPQLILGCVFSWGVVMAFPALEIDLLSQPQNLKAMAALYFSCIAWTMSYDTIYAAQDFKDDLKALVKSPMVRHQSRTRFLIFGAIVVQIALLLATGFAMNAKSIYYVCTCIGTSAILLAEVILVDLKDPRDCLWWFRNGCIYTGLMIGLGFSGNYIVDLFWMSMGM